MVAAEQRSSPVFPGAYEDAAHWGVNPLSFLHLGTCGELSQHILLSLLPTAGEGVRFAWRSWSFPSLLYFGFGKN